ncbi:TPA: hypothetical protein L9R01_003899 [Klebsiella pneumoniae]|nr:hypothetical protein [Klebsiella pneumoniae]HBV9604711.1 hypothetical protein [Klebsiella pneumoniae]HCB1359536.1 hypothetical protein [Klebsiella variicola subsp. variicola]HDZ2923500.1 hypothetical protein [Klebsiella pneumoniae]
MTDITELAQREKFEAWFKSSFHPDKTGPYIKDQLYFAWKAAGAELVEALEKAQQRITQLESRTVKLPDGWQFEECEIEGCENGAIFSVGTGSRNIHLCDKCAHEPQNSRLKKSPLSKRLPFKMSAGIKVEAE